MDFVTVVFAFGLGAVLVGMLLALELLVERTAPEDARSVRKDKLRTSFTHQ
jgi:hypothetical protein